MEWISPLFLSFYFFGIIIERKGYNYLNFVGLPMAALLHRSPQVASASF
jgi:hypothetical protein